MSSAEIRKYDAEDVREILNSHDQELTLDYLVELRKQSAFEEAEEPEPVTDWIGPCEEVVLLE
jgi:hypothetical protein